MENAFSLIDLDWVTLYDYLSLTSKNSVPIKINNFYESFFPLKYKKNSYDVGVMLKIQRSGFLGEMCKLMNKSLYVLDLFLASQIVICKTRETKDQIRLCQIFVEIERQSMQDALRLEYLANIINELTKRLSGKEKSDDDDQKSFMQIKVFCILNRYLDFIKWFYFFYLEQGHKQALQKLYETLFKIAFNTCSNNKSEIRLFPQIGELLILLIQFFSNDKKNQQAIYSLKIRKYFSFICTRQKNLMLQLLNEQIIQYLNKMNLEIPKDMTENYFRSQQEINTIVAEEEDVIEPILLHEHLRGTPDWRTKAIEQLVNLTIQKQVKQPSKLLLMEDFKKSKGFPLFFL